MELIEKLAALIPLPRFNLFRYSGVLAPNSKLRPLIILNPNIGEPDSLVSDQESSLPAAKYSWAKLMKRSFNIDMSLCPHCGSDKFGVVAVIEDPDIVSKILDHMGLESRAPPISPATYQNSFDYTEFS